MTIAFLDTEFTDLMSPQLLSIGLITLDGHEHYAELDLDTDIGKARRQASSDFVRLGGVLDMWGRVPGAACTAWELGRRNLCRHHALADANALRAAYIAVKAVAMKMGRKST